eukprot:m.788097 g.788097  ORF g.788097 m.788097 type:complete len:67 (-) comp23312_c0_seq4:617-817(-)
MRREAPADVGEGKEIDVIAAIVKAAQAEEHAKEVQGRMVHPTGVAPACIRRTCTRAKAFAVALHVS